MDMIRLFFLWFLAQKLLYYYEIISIIIKEFSVVSVNLFFRYRKRYLSDVQQLLVMTHKDLVVVWKNCIFKPLVQKYLVQFNLVKSPYFYLIVFACSENYLLL